MRLLVVILLFLGVKVNAQTFDSAYKPLQSNSIIQDRNFYFFTLMEKLPEVNTALNKHPELNKIWLSKTNALKNAALTCNEDASCHAKYLSWSKSEIDTIALILKEVYSKELSLKNLISQHLKRSGYFIKYESLPDTAILSNSWKDAAQGINNIIGIYGLGTKTKYPSIDSASYDVKSIVYRKNINIVVKTLLETAEKDQLFYYYSLQFALSLLDINMRDEAGRFEPLATFNKPALAYLKTIRWQDFKYSAILIPGAGPDISTAAIDPWVKSRIQLAVNVFRKGNAPVFIVSGGYVKPFQTPYCEALEMKKYLMGSFQIPDSLIIIEPYARHTTTNIRNASRLLFKYGFPVDKAALIISDQYQTITIQSNKFELRCLAELGYYPFSKIEMVNSFSTLFFPSIYSLHIDAIDPLDP